MFTGLIQTEVEILCDGRVLLDQTIVRADQTCLHALPRFGGIREPRPEICLLSSHKHGGPATLFKLRPFDGLFRFMTGDSWKSRRFDGFGLDLTMSGKDKLRYNHTHKSRHPSRRCINMQERP